MVSINRFSPLGGAVQTQASPMDDLWRSQTDSSRRQKPAEPIIGSLLGETKWFDLVAQCEGILGGLSAARVMILCTVKVSNHALDVKIRSYRAPVKR